MRKPSQAPESLRIRSLLVPLDGSPFAEQALPWATMIARAARARLRLALVHQSPPAPPLDQASARLYTQIELTVRKSEREYLRCVVGRIRAENSIQTVVAMLQGSPAQALGRYVKDMGPDLVVMTTHGRGGFRRAWLGSVADQLVRSLEIPLLLIRPTEDAVATEAAPEVGEILVALDGSRRAEAALPPAMALARALRAKLALVQVVQPIPLMTDPPMAFPTGYDDELTGVRRREAQDYLGDVAERLTAQGVPASSAVVVGGSVFDAIQDAARAPGTGLVALATHGRGGVGRMVIGSVADKLVRAGEHPVLVTRPRGK